MNMVYVKKTVFERVKKQAEAGNISLLGIQELAVMDLLCLTVVLVLMALKYFGVLPALSADALWVACVFLVINVYRLLNILRGVYARSD